MRTTRRRQIVAAACLAGIAALVAGPTRATAAEQEFAERTLRTDDGATIRYLLVEPDTAGADADTEAERSVLIALPPGNQQRAMAAWGLRIYWAAEARRRGWIVASPIRTGETMLYNGTESQFVALVRHLGTTARLRGGKVYLAGVSNGGLSAFHAAITHPELVHALLVLPGYPPGEDDHEHLKALRGIPVTMLVGAEDAHWVARMEDARAALTAAGGTVTLRTMPGEAHVLRSLGGGRELFEILAPTP
jgi:pimeloyl-ACP methyl ester carboxylesterase